MNVKKPLVSVVIPIYNSSKFIMKTLSSLDKQSFRNYEIIMINDGSTDNSMDILKSYSINKNNVILYDQKNSGVSAARNKGIELANGEFVTFLDSDDIYAPTFLEKMLAKQNEKNADLIYCGFNRIGMSGKLSKISNIFEEGNILNFYLQRNGYFHFSGMLIRRKILLDHMINFEVGRNISEDLLFTVKLLSNVDCYCVKENLFHYVERSESIMTSNWSKDKWFSDIEGRRAILSYLTENYNKKDKSEVLKSASAFIFQREISYLTDCLKKMKYKEIKTYLKSPEFCKKEKLFEEDILKHKDKKKFLVIKKNNNVIWFFYTLYYRFFRFNVKHL